MHELSVRDHRAREKFCYWLLQNNEADENFLANIMHYYDIVTLDPVYFYKSNAGTWRSDFPGAYV